MASHKRANGEGTIFRTRDGKWKATISLGRDANGRRRRRTKVANTRADAAALLREMQNSIGANQPEPSKQKLADFLARWLADKVQPNRAASTHALWKHAVDKHLVPHIGHLRLDRITPLDVEHLLKALSGAPSRMRQLAFEVLRNALNYAGIVGVVAANPCLRVEKPTHARKKIQPFTAEETQAILKAARDTRLHALYRLAFETGMRQGELFGLEWRFVDLKAGTVRIELQASDVKGRVSVRPAKTKASIRTLEITPAAIAALNEHRAALLKAGLAKCKLVFPAPGGGYMTRGNFRVRSWKPLLKPLGISHRGFHHVRHTFATLMLGDGQPVHVVSKILGHSRPSVTWDTYSHLLKSQQSEATARIAQIFAS